MSLTVVPMTLREASAFVTREHRHHTYSSGDVAVMVDWEATEKENE